MAKEHPMYASTEWPEYEWQEYPRCAYPGSKDGGKTPDPDPRKPGKFLQEMVMVQDEAEWLRVTSTDAKPDLVETGAGTSRVRTAEDDRTELMEKLEAAGVTFDKRWGLPRLESAWDEHEASKNEVV